MCIFEYRTISKGNFGLVTVRSFSIFFWGCTAPVNTFSCCLVAATGERSGPNTARWMMQQISLNGPKYDSQQNRASAYLRCIKSRRYFCWRREIAFVIEFIITTIVCVIFIAAYSAGLIFCDWFLLLLVRCRYSNRIGLEHCGGCEVNDF